MRMRVHIVESGRMIRRREEVREERKNRRVLLP